MTSTPQTAKERTQSLFPRRSQAQGIFSRRSQGDDGHRNGKRGNDKRSGKEDRSSNKRRWERRGTRRLREDGIGNSGGVSSMMEDKRRQRAEQKQKEEEKDNSTGDYVYNEDEYFDADVEYDPSSFTVKGIFQSPPPPEHFDKVNEGIFSHLKPLEMEDVELPSDVQKGKFHSSSTPYNILLHANLKKGRMSMAERVLQEYKAFKRSGRKKGGNQKVTVQTLIQMLQQYGEVRDIDKAEQLFKSLPEEPLNIPHDANVFNGMLACYGVAGEMDKMFETYAQMKSRGIISPNADTPHHTLVQTFNQLLRGILIKYKNIINLEKGTFSKTPTNAELYKEKMGQVLQEMRRTKVRPNIFTYNRLLEISSKMRDIPMMTAIFDELASIVPIEQARTMDDSPLKSQEYKYSGRASPKSRSDIAYDEIPPVPDVYTFTIMIQTLCQKGDNAGAERYLRLMMQSYRIQPNKFTWQPIIDYYCKRSQPHQALNVFLKMPKEIHPDYFFFTSLISGFGNVGDTEMALKVFHMAKEVYNISPNEVLYTAIINMFSSLDDIDNAHKFLNEMLEHGFKPNKYTVSSLVFLYSRNEMDDMTMELLEKMRSHHVIVANITYEAIMAYMAKRGKYSFAVRLLDIMLEEYERLLTQRIAFGHVHSIMQPRIETFNQLMKVFLSADMPQRTIEIYDRLSQHKHKTSSKLTPDRLTFRCVIGAHSKLGNHSEVLNIYKQHLTDKNLNPDASILTSLMNSCISEGHIDAALGVIRFLSEEQEALLSVDYLGDKHHHLVRTGFGPKHALSLGILNDLTDQCHSLLDGGCDKYDIPKSKVKDLLDEIHSVEGTHAQLFSKAKIRPPPIFREKDVQEDNEKGTGK